MASRVATLELFFDLVFILVGGAVGGRRQYVLLVATAAFTWGLTGLTSAGGFGIAPAHFVERHGLVVLIEIGETVVSIGVGAGAQEVGVRLVGIAILALALNACLWWAYFGGGDDARAEAALLATPEASPARQILIAFGFWHIPLLLGIVATAAGLEPIVEHPGRHVHPSGALLVAGGSPASSSGICSAAGRSRSGRSASGLWRFLRRSRRRSPARSSEGPPRSG